MIRAFTLLAGLLVAHLAHADTSRQAAKSEQALLRDLEARYEQCMQAARRGDVPGYWRLRTAAARSRLGEADATRIRLLAELLPPLDTLQFVRLDGNPKIARALYRWRKDDVAQYSVVVFRHEQGEWKLDDVSVRRSPVNGPGTPAVAQASPPRPAPLPSSGPAVEPLDAQSQALLRAWSSGKSDPSRALAAPRL